MWKEQVVPANYFIFIMALMLSQSAFGADSKPASLLVGSFVKMDSDFNNDQVWRREREEDEPLTQLIQTPGEILNITYCKLIAYTLIRNPDIAGIAVVPVWREETDPVAKIWGRRDGKKYYTLWVETKEAEGKWAKPITDAEMFVIPKIWHHDATASLTGLEVKITSGSQSKTFRVLLSQFFVDPSFVKKLPRTPQTPAPIFAPVFRKHRRG